MFDEAVSSEVTIVAITPKQDHNFYDSLFQIGAFERTSLSAILA